MSWQQYKDSGEPIYIQTHYGDIIGMEKIRRVIYSIAKPNQITNRVVRYMGQWQPLHELTNLKTRYRNEDGTYTLVYLYGQLLTKQDEQLPFIRKSDNSCGVYHVYGF